ncbi:MAG: tetratricopeptide repeat protein [Verrucomicrobiota bacterium]|nr:tetratricopeptide repeat protein [Verrucomicrobiota bacterium]
MKRFIRQASFFCALVLLSAAGCNKKNPAAAPADQSFGNEEAGDRAFAAGQADRALELWSKALESQPNESRLLEKIAPALMNRALAQRKLHRWTEALADAQKAIALNGSDPEVHRGAKVFLRLSPQLPGIRELDARLAVTPDDDQLLADRALLFLRSDDYELALADSEAAAQKAEWAMRPRLFRALALIGLGRGAECATLGIELPLRLTSLSPDFLETIARLDSEISLERANVELYLARAWQLNEIGQPRLALHDAETALEHDANSAGAFAERSYALSKLGRADEAFAQIKRATELDANFATAWQYRGELELARGDFAAAADSLSHALTLDPNYAALQKREQAYRQLGLIEKADEDQRALEALAPPH